MQYPIAELYDRHSIETLKEQRIPGYKSEFILEANKIFENASEDIFNLWIELVYWNGKIWDLESDIRKGKEGELGLEEVGRRALAIRDLNNKRIEVKNKIADLCNGFKETKFNHASQ